MGRAGGRGEGEEEKERKKKKKGGRKAAGGGGWRPVEVVRIRETAETTEMARNSSDDEAQ